MKKAFGLFIVFLLVIGLSACITIHIPGNTDESGTIEESVSESRTEEETATKEQETEPTENQPGESSSGETEPAYTAKKEDFIGSYFGKGNTRSLLTLFEDDTIQYSEKNENLQVLSGGIGGYWTVGEDGKAHITMPLSETDELEFVAEYSEDQLTITADHENMWKSQIFVRRTFETDDIEREIKSYVIADLFPDGTYTANSYMDYDEAVNDYAKGQPAVKYAYIIDGVMTLYGSIGQYDSEWNMKAWPVQTYEIPLTDDFEVYANQGETDVKKDNDYFSQVFFEEVVGLGMTLEIENGYVKSVTIYS
ncbi:MAG: hypothetical protein IK088_04140 [Lachnospiraceae bacterium]|nr:hypothetical protein [Lachnospiraceae bacterium]